MLLPFAVLSFAEGRRVGMGSFRVFSIFFFVLFSTTAMAQERIDSSLVFHKDSIGHYSLFVPSSYVPREQIPVMVALHPFNRKRWNAESWCNEMMVFAEQNGLLLVCPDGGDNGTIDDSVDMELTNVLLDSIENWYNIDTNRVYLTGFSWGGKAVYSFGLATPNRYSGFIPIGAVMSTSNKILEHFPRANWKPFFIIHGETDRPEARFTWVRDSLVKVGAIVETRLLKGVGHTIEFDDREALLTRAFTWVDSVNIAVRKMGSDSLLRSKSGLQSEIPEIVMGDANLQVKYLMAEPGVLQYQISDISGKVVTTKEVELGRGNHAIKIPLSEIPWGVYLIQFTSKGQEERAKFMIRG